MTTGSAPNPRTKPAAMKNTESRTAKRPHPSGVRRTVPTIVMPATVVAVRVLDRRGSGSNSGVIDGVDYVAGVASATVIPSWFLPT